MFIVYYLLKIAQTCRQAGTPTAGGGSNFIFAKLKPSPSDI